jgi:hypothetical protein
LASLSSLYFFFLEFNGLMTGNNKPRV